MSVHQEVISVKTCEGKPSYHDIKADVERVVAESGIKNGIVVAQTSHTTCSVIFEEYVHDYNWQGDEFLQGDLNRILDRLIPRELEEGREWRYPGPAHVKFLEEYAAENPGFPADPASILNGDAHLRASLMGSSQTFVLSDGVINTGEFGHIYLVDWDQNRERTRKVSVCVMGE